MGNRNMIIRLPGSPDGPCTLDMKCLHLDCALDHDVAAKVCPLCERPIGYGREVEVGLQVESACDGQYVHFDCLRIASAWLYMTNRVPVPARALGAFLATWGVEGEALATGVLPQDFCFVVSAEERLRRALDAHSEFRAAWEHEERRNDGQAT